MHDPMHSEHLGSDLARRMAESGVLHSAEWEAAVTNESSPAECVTFGEGVR